MVAQVRKQAVPCHGGAASDTRGFELLLFGASAKTREKSSCGHASILIETSHFSCVRPKLLPASPPTLERHLLPSKLRRIPVGSSKIESMALAPQFHFCRGASLEFVFDAIVVVSGVYCGCVR